MKSVLYLGQRRFLELYLLGDIQPPELVVKAMHSQVSAERQKRAQILESEGVRQSAINVAEGRKQSEILASEACRQEKINAAEGEAQAVLVKAHASAESIRMISDAIEEKGTAAVSMIVAEKYIRAFEKLAQESNTLLLPTNVGDPAGIITQAMSIYKTIGGSSLPKDKP